MLRQLNERGLLTNTTLLGEGVREPARDTGGRRGVRARARRHRACGAAHEPRGQADPPRARARHRADVREPRRAHGQCGEARQLRAHGHGGVALRRSDTRRLPAPPRTAGRRTSASSSRRTSIAPSGISRSLLDLEPNVRVCKGAYLEPPEVAYPEKEDVDAAYVRLLELALRRAGFVGIATHDERMIEHAIAFVAREQIPGERFQFQMLYGVRPQLQLSLVRRGYPVLVATPYGPDWYRYLMRRLAERPANIALPAPEPRARLIRLRSWQPAGRTRRRCRDRA